MKTIADLKRAMTVGTVVTFSEHRYPLLNGERTVLKAQTQRVATSAPEGHPRKTTIDQMGGSWMDFPKRDEAVFDGSKTVQIVKDGEPFCKITVP